jgi:hypothetical protein
MNQPGLAGSLQRTPEGGDVRVDQVRLGIEVQIPDLAEQLGPADRAAGIEHQVLQQAKLPGRQRNGAVAPPHAPLEAVELEGSGLEDPLDPGGALAAGQRPHPGQQLHQRKGLDQVVVGAGVEPDRHVLGSVAAGQDQDRHRDPLLPDGGAHLEAVGLGDLDVEHDQIVRGIGPHLGQGGAAVQRHVHGVTVLLEALLQEPDGSNVVLDYENVHASSWRATRGGDDGDLKLPNP